MKKLALAILLFCNTSQAFELKATGKNIYENLCARCHTGVAKNGQSLGPDLKGASWVLIFTKTTTGGYPKGYTPKSNTSVMPILKITEQQAKDIANYLESLK